MRAGENSLNTQKTPSAGLFLTRMQLFYELFPYPNRPFFMKPNPHGSVETHAGTSQLLALTSDEQKTKVSEKISLSEARAAFNSDKRIALVGCGTDEPLLFRVLHPNNPIVAIDLSRSSLARAARKLRWHGLKPVTCVHGDAQVALQHETPFDHIQCFGVLHHQPEPEKLITAMADKLKTGGTLRLMIYSCTGRRLERGLQKKFALLWRGMGEKEDDAHGNSHPHSHTHSTLEFTQPSPSARLKLAGMSLLLLLWRLFLPLLGSSAKAGRFRYIGFSRARVADALLHPSDHALSLKNTIAWAQTAGLALVAYKAKSYDLGQISSHSCPPVALQTLVDEEERGNISTNIVLVFKKVGSP
ncbi:MAG: hypothetical protein RIR26_943 [Pseudomonadota bacterium]